MAKTNKVQVGFKETKEALDFVIALGKAIEASLEDGKLSIGDLPNFIVAFTQLFDGIENMDEIPLEFKVATKEEVEELKQYVKTELDLNDDMLEAFIEDSFKIILDIFVVLQLYFLKEKGILGKSGDAKAPETAE